MTSLAPFPRLYAIAGADFFRDTDALLQFTQELLSGGVTLLQYRNKAASSRVMLDQARELKRLTGDRARLIMNDRADVCLAAGFDGLHLGQDDLSVEAARHVIGAQLCLGYSTHNPTQLQAADATSADYFAIGPVFATSTKQNPDPLVGLEGVRAARALTRKPLVAIGGITRANCRSVIAAGADSVAVVADLLQGPRQAAAEFLRILA